MIIMNIISYKLTLVYITVKVLEPLFLLKIIIILPSTGQVGQARHTPAGPILTTWRMATLLY